MRNFHPGGYVLNSTGILSTEEKTTSRLCGKNIMTMKITNQFNTVQLPISSNKTQPVC